MIDDGSPFVATGRMWLVVSLSDLVAMPPVYDCLQYARIAYSMQELLTVCKNCLQYARIAYSMQELLTVCKNISLNCKTGGVEGLGMRLTAVSKHEDVYYIMGLSYCRRSHMSMYIDELTTMTEDTCPMSISYSLYATRLYVEDMKAHYCRIACAFAFLNILTPIVLAKSLSWYYPRVRAVASGRHFTACLYWAAALIAFLCNVVYTENSLYRHYYHNQPLITSCIAGLSGHNCSLPSDTRLYKDEVFTLMSKITIIPIAVFAELVVSVHATRHHVIGRRYGRRRCFCLHQTIHVLALWNILILLQIFTMCAIPSAFYC